MQRRKVIETFQSNPSVEMLGGSSAQSYHFWFGLATRGGLSAVGGHRPPLQ